MKDIPDGQFDTIYCDPVWPNNALPEFAHFNPRQLFASAAVHFPRLAKRVLVHLGCDSDPRILDGVPDCLPFFRVVNLRYARPHFKGRVLYDRDIVYVFGPPPPSRPGFHAISGDFCYTDFGESKYGHPCPRRLGHVKWLLHRYAGGPVLDPFAGSCTTAEACIDLSIPYCCIEINGEYCKAGNRRVKERLQCGLQTESGICAA